MTPTTLLLRQVHPTFLVGGEVGSQAFRPTPKDHDRLSFEDGDRITAEDSWRRFDSRGLRSVGVLGVQVVECEAEGLPVVPDGEPVPEHVSVVFSAKTTGQRKQIAKRLRDRARERGWLYSAVT